MLMMAAGGCEFGWPVWQPGPVVPSLLDLVFVVIGQRSAGGGLVFWGGVAGLLGDVVHHRPIGTELMLSATVALVWVVSRGDARRRRSFTTTVLSSLGMLVLLGAGRFAMNAIHQPTVLWLPLKIAAAELALTFLMSVVACLMMAVGRRPSVFQAGSGWRRTASWK